MHFPGCFTGIRESPQIHRLQLCQHLPNIISVSAGTKSSIVLEFLISSNLHLQGTYFQLGTQHLKLQLLLHSEMQDNGMNLRSTNRSGLPQPIVVQINAQRDQINYCSTWCLCIAAHWNGAPVTRSYTSHIAWKDLRYFKLTKCKLPAPRLCIFSYKGENIFPTFNFDMQICTC